MTVQELRTRQGWTLSQKIDHAVGTVEAFLSRTGKVPYVSFSGGKDSTVLLDIVRRFVDRDIKAVFCNTGNEFPEIVRFVRSTDNVTIIRPGITVREVIGKYGFPLPPELRRRSGKLFNQRSLTLNTDNMLIREKQLNLFEDPAPDMLGGCRLAVWNTRNPNGLNTASISKMETAATSAAGA